MSGRIVVGIDGSEGSGSALHWALDEGRRRGSRLDVVHVWHILYAGGGRPHGDRGPGRRRPARRGPGR